MFNQCAAVSAEAAAASGSPLPITRGQPVRQHGGRRECHRLYSSPALATAAYPPRHIQFEITETAAVKHLPEAKRLIATLRSVGVSIALDDFGSGLSSFAYLKELPIDCLKIDSSFIHTMENSDVDYSVVSTINHLGHIMGVSTVAEGVSKTKSQHQLLEKNRRRLYLQGFLVQHPQPLDKILSTNLELAYLSPTFRPSYSALCRRRPVLADHSAGCAVGERLAAARQL